MIYRFGDYSLDPRSYEFRCGGDARDLEPQVFGVLLYLVENRDRVVSKDDLIAAVWDGRIVSDATLSSRISAARQAVGDTGEAQDVIRTIRSRGFRFVADVETADDDGSPERPGAEPDGSQNRSAQNAVRAEETASSLAQKPTLAVLPFANMSRDPDQDYFCDGITEEIITALSKLSDLFVIASSSAFTYKGRPVEVLQVARELGVRYVLQGSVRTAGTRVRISGHLVDTETGQHLWAERYEREPTDVFELQDEITREVVTALQVRLTEGEQARLRRRQTNDLAAWECFARSQEQLRRFNKEDNLVARGLLEQALRHDPEFSAAWTFLAWTHLVDARLAFSTSAEVSLEQGAALAAKSLSIDECDPDALAIQGAIRLLQRRFDEAEADCRKAVEYGPNVAEVFAWLATVLNYTGRAQEGLGLIEKAMRFSPFHPDWYLGIQGVSYRVLGRFEEAIAVDLKRLARNPSQPLSNFRLAAIYTETGNDSQARAQVAELLKKNPNASIRQVRISEPYRDEGELERYLDLLRKAGLPE